MPFDRKPWYTDNADDRSRVTEFDEYQEITRSTAVYPGAMRGLDENGAPSKAAISYCVMGLTSEAGEVADQVKKIMRGDHDNDYEAMERALIAIQEELGDTAWYLARLADEIEVHLSVICADNVTKLQDRWQRGKIWGDGVEDQ